MKSIYKAAKGFPINDDDAQVIGTSLEVIEKEYGNVTPELVLNVGRSVSSPLHKFFDWDDEQASEKWRKHQARKLIQSIEVVINYETGESQKAFFNIREDFDENTPLVYVNIERALSEKELRKQILNNALREITYWKAKYHTYKEFKGIIGAISIVQKKLIRRKK